MKLAVFPVGRKSITPPEGVPVGVQVMTVFCAPTSIVVEFTPGVIVAPPASIAWLPWNACAAARSGAAAKTAAIAEAASNAVRLRIATRVRRQVVRSIRSLPRAAPARSG